MTKKFLSFMLSVCLVLALATSAYAKELVKPNTINPNANLNAEMLNDPLYHSERTIINSQTFTPNNNITSSDVGAYGPIELPGTVRIDDSVTSDSGIQQQTSKSGMWETIKFATVNIIPYVPVVGQLTSTCITIYDGITAIYTDIRNFDTSKTTSIYTRYVYKYFYHTGYVMDNNNSWKFEGESTSKYYYKVQTFDAIVNGNFMSRTASYTAGNGYGTTAIAKAPNYMNKTALANIFYEKWVMQQSPYYETY